MPASLFCRPVRALPGSSGRSVATPLPSSALMAPMTRRFTDSLERFARDPGVDVVTFGKGVRKDDVTQGHLRGRPAKACPASARRGRRRAPCARQRIDTATGRASAEIVDSAAMVNAFHVCLVDDDFRPCFITFRSCFPYSARLSINGHECRKRQMERRPIPFEALDNGIMSRADPAAMQDNAGKIDAALTAALFRKLLARLPHPVTTEDRATGIVRENLDIGRVDRPP